MSDAVKDRIGHYQLLDLIGDGAQGKIFKAVCIDAGDGPVARDEVVAIKVLRVPPDDERAQLRFQAQADILKRLAHPHIIRYRDSFIWHPGEWDEAQCLVMEYLDGETLASRLAATRRGLPWPEVKTIFEQCLDGLIHAGQQGIIHRDLKPSNLFLTRDGSARIFDFDIARVEGQSQRSTVGWKGSFDYMAPDFVTEADFHGDEVSDIFSLGTCICQALTGRLPFEPLGESAHIGYLNRWRNADTPPALSFRAGAYRVLANAKSFVSRSLSLQRDRRYSSFAEMLADFQRIRYRVVQHLGKDTYELRDMLGRGGFGEVFQGVRLSDGQPVAIKHLFAERQSARFIKEAKALQGYAHPFLVKYIDFIEARSATRESQYFLVLELLGGMPEACLRSRIKREGKLEPAEAIPLFLNYLEALSFLHGHARPLIHRDIKPMNLYAPAGHPENAKVFDLGVVRDVSGTVTSGGIPGTLDYMAPEFARSGADRGTRQSDLYSLGLCLYETLTGQTVFPRLPPDINSSWPMFQERARNRPAIDYQARVFRLYPDLMAVVRKAIALQPGDRYASAAAMRQDLEKVLLRLDQPEELPPVEEPTTVAAPTPLSLENIPSEKIRRSSSSGLILPAIEENREAGLPDLPDVDMAGDAVAAWADRRKRAVRAAVVILVLLAAGAGATLWWSRTDGGSRLASKPAPASALPSPVQTVALGPAEAPSESDSDASLMGLTADHAGAQETALEKTLGRYELDAAAAEIARLIPSSFSGDQDLEQAEQAAEALETMAGRDWPGITAAAKQAKITPLRAALTAGMQAGMAAWRDEAIAQYRKGQDGESRHAALALLPDNAPAAVALVKPAYQDALKAVDAARADWDRMTGKQRTVLKAIETGSDQVDRGALADLPAEPERVIDVAAAARRVRKGFNTLALLDAEEPSRVFLARVADCWRKAAPFEGPLGDAIRDAAWMAIHDQMLAQGAILLKPQDMMLAGVRTPEQQARLRREYLRLLAQIETVTGRVSGCREDDLLRIQVNRFFQRPFFHRALLEDPAFAGGIPWLAEVFRKAQPPS